VLRHRLVDVDAPLADDDFLRSKRGCSRGRGRSRRDGAGRVGREGAGTSPRSLTAVRLLLLML